MAIRQTSIDCYNQIKAEGLLSKRRLEVYEAIFKSAPCTSAEAMQGRLNSTNVLSQSRARFTELRELDVIYEKGDKVCGVTGRKAIVWDLTDRLPVKENKPITAKQQRVNNVISALRELYKRKGIASDDEWKNVVHLINKI